MTDLRISDDAMPRWWFLAVWSLPAGLGLLAALGLRVAGPLALLGLFALGVSVASVVSGRPNADRNQE